MTETREVLRMRPGGRMGQRIARRKRSRFGFLRAGLMQCFIVGTVSAVGLFLFFGTETPRDLDAIRRAQEARRLVRDKGLPPMVPRDSDAATATGEPTEASPFPDSSTHAALSRLRREMRNAVLGFRRDLDAGAYDGAGDRSAGLVRLEQPWNRWQEGFLDGVRRSAEVAGVEPDGESEDPAARAYGRLLFLPEAILSSWRGGDATRVDDMADDLDAALDRLKRTAPQ